MFPISKQEVSTNRGRDILSGEWYVPCHGHWDPLVTNATPGSTTGPGWDRCSRAGRRVHLLRHGNLISLEGVTSVADGRSRAVVGLAGSCCHDTFYTRLHYYCGVWRVYRQHCCLSTCQAPGDLFKPKLHNHELWEFAGGRLSDIGAVPRL